MNMYLLPLAEAIGNLIRRYVYIFQELSLMYLVFENTWFVLVVIILDKYS